MKSQTVIATVANFKYLRKNLSQFIYEIRNNGKFEGKILILTSIFTPTFLFASVLKDRNVQVIRFKTIKLTRTTNRILKNLNTGKEPNRHNTKKFQWHKIHLFDKRLKKWKYIFYLDINMRIHFDINLILYEKPNDSFFARSDSYPEYNKTLSSQFDVGQPLYQKLSNKYDLNISNYFQTGVMYFDTSIIKNNTKEEILDLIDKFPISITNEQGILNIYLIYIRNLYVELNKEIGEFLTYYYWLVKDKKIIITKQNRFKYK